MRGVSEGSSRGRRGRGEGGGSGESDWRETLASLNSVTFCSLLRERERERGRERALVHT